MKEAKWMKGRGMWEKIIQKRMLKLSFVHNYNHDYLYVHTSYVHTYVSCTCTYCGSLNFTENFVVVPCCVLFHGLTQPMYHHQFVYTYLHYYTDHSSDFLH